MPNNSFTYLNVMNDLFGKALFDYSHNNVHSPLILHNKFSGPDELDLEGYFFEEEDFTELEHYALGLCRGKILDAGAAAGRHCLYLQKKGRHVTGLDISASCCEIMKSRGVENVCHADFFDYEATDIDTLLMLMNGIGLVGNLDGLKVFLGKAEKILSKNGQIIFDSSDVSYLKKSYTLPPKKYFGEIDYQYEYEGIYGTWFTWLYIDPAMLHKIASGCGWQAQIIFQDDDGQFLARLIKL